MGNTNSQQCSMLSRNSIRFACFMTPLSHHRAGRPPPRMLFHHTSLLHSGCVHENRRTIAVPTSETARLPFIVPVSTGLVRRPPLLPRSVSDPPTRPKSAPAACIWTNEQRARRARRTRYHAQTSTRAHNAADAPPLRQ